MDGLESWIGARIDWPVLDKVFEGRIERAEAVAGVLRVSGVLRTGGRFVFVVEDARYG